MITIAEFSTLQKPDTVDNITYEKPNAYDEDPPVVITASRHNSRSSKMTVDSYASRYFQRRGPTAITCFSTPPPSTTISPVTTTNSSGNYYSPNTPMESPPPSPKSCIKRQERKYNTKVDYRNITSFILSQPIPTTQTHFRHHHEDVLTIDNETPSSPKNSVIGVETMKKSTDIAAAAAALLSNDSNIVSSFFLQQNKRRGPKIRNITTTAPHKKLSTNPNSNVITYSFRKSSTLTPDQHEIFLHIDHPDEDDEDVMVYRKIQPHSYIWGGLQSMLYSNRNDGQGIKVAEARRNALKNDIVIEAADYENSLIEDITQPYIDNIRNIPATNNIHCHKLIKKSQSNILFEYEIWFHGSLMRWRRPSLLSHDFTCEIKLTRQDTKLFHQKNRGRFHAAKDDGFIDSDSDDDDDDHDSHTHKTCRRWKLVAEFDSHTMSFVNKELGMLSIDLDMLNQVEKENCNLLEANIVMTCCTLIDLIRSIMGK
ncbi:hypothetical protein INT47_007041 [Mucor saturninus]|uniref:Uncharacterized protein n=1 Tax=Mucor saturninus TaxID=64648 RepID=A0A8H7R3Z6_9FUNG|nr:hypothetical protein INT47_007041 [Mucor saturninus]